MSIIVKEILYLSLTLLSGTYAGVVVVGQLTERFASDGFTLHFPAIFNLPIWSIIFLAPLAWYFRRKYYWLHKMRIHKCQPAAVFPHRDPFLGIDWISNMVKAVRSFTILQVWDRYFHTIGNTFWAQNVGDWILMTNEPENVKALLQSQFETWPIGGLRQKVLIMALGPRGIFSVNGKEWHTARSMIRPSFVRNQIADLECTDRHVENFLERIPRDGGKVDLQDLFYLFTMDVSTDFMFGYSTNTLVKPSPEALDFTQSFDYALLSASNRARLGWVAFLLPDKKLDSSVATCKRFIDRYIQEALAEGQTKERPYVFMNEMLDSGASHEYIQQQLLAMILGGRDTSASTMSSLFWVLARRPDVLRKLREEIGTLEGRRPSWEDLKDLKYLNMVFKETLRLWAPVSTNSRLSATDTILPRGGGPEGKSPLFVPKGTLCRWSLHSLHRRKDVFGEDAEEFRPERWEKLRTMWEYLPFSGGPRICIGQQFALTQMLYLTTRVLQTFEMFEAADDKPMVQESTWLISSFFTIDWNPIRTALTTFGSNSSYREVELSFSNERIMSIPLPNNTGELMPFASSAPTYRPENHQAHKMGPVEIGVILGTIGFFVITISIIFYFRHVDQRQRKAQIAATLRRVEEGHDGYQSTSTQDERRQRTKSLAWWRFWVREDTTSKARDGNKRLEMQATQH
ncbi:Fc.00g038010.m01.CDS01 [Cosmosporella sp. VM-42]